MSGSCNSEADSEGGQGSVGIAAVVAERGGEVDRPNVAEHAGGEVAQGCHDLRRGPGAELGGVFCEGTSHTWCSRFSIAQRPSATSQSACSRWVCSASAVTTAPARSTGAGSGTKPSRAPPRERRRPHVAPAPCGWCAPWPPITPAKTSASRRTRVRWMVASDGAESRSGASRRAPSAARTGWGVSEAQGGASDQESAPGNWRPGRRATLAANAQTARPGGAVSGPEGLTEASAPVQRW
jgi:hypothetical protein